MSKSSSLILGFMIKKMTNWCLIALFTLFAQSIAYNVSCYTDYTQVIGSDIGGKVDDMTSISSVITSLNADYRSAAIKSCKGTSAGNLMGHQIAIADYTKLP